MQKHFEFRVLQIHESKNPDVEMSSTDFITFIYSTKKNNKETTSKSLFYFSRTHLIGTSGPIYILSFLFFFQFIWGGKYYGK